MPTAFGSASQAPPANVPNPGVSDIIKTARPSMRPSNSTAKPGNQQSKLPSTQSAIKQPSILQSQSTQLKREPSSAPEALSQKTLARKPSGLPDIVISRASVQPQNQFTQLKRDALLASQSPPREVSVQLPTNQSTLPRTTLQQQPHATQLRRDVYSNYQPPSVKTDRPTQSNFTNLRRDQTKMSVIKEASAAPTVRAPSAAPTKNFPPACKSVLRTQDDFIKASRQTMINQMDALEREQQDTWAREKISEMPDVCPQKYAYQRRGDGYVCAGGSHYISDELIAEGMGGMYAIKNSHDWENRSDGPYYVAKEENGTLWFQKLSG